ncbi:hypothetical protein [Paraburkholderia sp. BCC1886]|uniref:hypothetical protein n=1 Tax=Paraburkholderia sp. BCC1886 TaxID=2562670 RepID=UPI0011826982|nr:hypothetical protein [Paraburkholderia sp. BCC1886]
MKITNYIPALNTPWAQCFEEICQHLSVLKIGTDTELTVQANVSVDGKKALSLCAAGTDRFFFAGPAPRGEIELYFVSIVSARQEAWDSGETGIASARVSRENVSIEQLAFTILFHLLADQCPTPESIIRHPDQRHWTAGVWIRPKDYLHTRSVYLDRRRRTAPEALPSTERRQHAMTKFNQRLRERAKRYSNTFRVPTVAE